MFNSLRSDAHKAARRLTGRFAKKDMKQKTIISLLVCIFISGCATSTLVTRVKPKLTEDQKQNWSMLIGKWYTKQPINEGGYTEILSTKQPNGKYINEFRTSDNAGNFKNSIEIGEWGISGNIYFTSFRGWVKPEGFKLSNPSNPYNYDAYFIKELSNEIFVYDHVHTGNSYIMKKVTEDFKLPELNQIHYKSFKQDRDKTAAF